MRRGRVLAAAALGLLLAAVVGCGDEKMKYVSVSGVVKLNGKPYPNAIVTFQPVGGKDNQNPGRGSTGITDENGRYVLKTDGDQRGALVGLHQVKIRTQGEVVGYDPTVGSPDNAPGPEKGKIDPIPTDWRSLSDKHVFEVPAEGTDQANFDITNPRAK
jgi:hypothetical protein